jgi:hypothetical protein
MGTDFNYLYSEEMRKIISDNCMESNQDFLNFKEYHDSYRDDSWAEYLPNANGRNNMNDPQFMN